MRPIIGGSFESSGFVLISNSALNPRPLNSFTIDTIGTAALKARSLFRSSKSLTTSPSSYPYGSHCRISTTFLMEPSLSSVLSEVAES